MTGIKLYPVPVKDILNIQLPVGKSHAMLLEIYAADGRKVFTSSTPNILGNRMNVNISHLPRGSYFGRLQQGDKSYPLNFTKE